MNSIADKIKRHGKLPHDGYQGERKKVYTFQLAELLSLLEAVAEEQRESDSQVTSICKEFIAENGLITDQLKQRL